MIINFKQKKETGFSLLELSVAVGVAAIVATAGIVATTAFIGSAQDKRDSYTSNANSAIENAEASSLALGASGIGGDSEGTPSLPQASPITSLSITAGSNDGEAVLSWAAPSTPVTSYTIKLDGSIIATLDSSANSYTVSGLTYPNTYEAEIISYNDSAEAVQTVALVPETYEGALSTSSTVWSAYDGGIRSTATSRDGTLAFEGGRSIDGWKGDAFISVGDFGFSKRSWPDEKNYFGAWTSNTLIEQGSESTFSSFSQVIVDSLTRVTANPSASVQGDSISYTLTMEDMWANSLSGLTMFFEIQSAAGANVEYTPLANGSLLIQDSTGKTASALVTATSDRGVIEFGKSVNGTPYEDIIPGELTPAIPLVDGEPEAALFINDLGTAFEANINIFILDGDPCSDSKIEELAAQIDADPASFVGQDLSEQLACSPAAQIGYYK